MIGDGPIRISVDEWVVVRNNPRFPKALVKKFSTDKGDYYRVVTFTLIPEDRVLIGRYPTLEVANDAVPYDLPDISHTPAARGTGSAPKLDP